ncbi:CARDB domain-containing protein [Candidatus Eisenbacteria bacterium]|uniref:CARDB domain-containing protein n=1 Tax=Eiseniibacteriota bacterium TaxID=2212470 RepID=A0ABV6YNP8_UNCEI
MTIPQSTYEATYYMSVYADQNDHIDEHGGEGNNLGWSSPIYVQYIPPDQPDLWAYGFQGPTTGWAGDSISVSWTVENIGDLGAVGLSHKDWVMISEDSIPSTADRHIGPSFTGEDLFPDSSYSREVTLMLPLDLSGDYFLFVWTDVFDRYGDPYPSSNLSNVRPISITPIPPADLQVTSITLSTDSLGAGDQVDVQWEVANVGAGPTYAGSWQDRVYMSEDMDLDTEIDLLVATIPFSGNLAIDGSCIRDTLVSVPSGISGIYYLFVCTDTGDEVEEGDYELNNCGVAVELLEVTPTFTDLIVQHVGQVGELWSGQYAGLEWTITNQGTGSAVPGWWIDAVFLSIDDSLSQDEDIWLGSVSHIGELGQSESYTDTVSLLLPHGAEGGYYVFVLTDSTDVVTEEGAESNNLASSAVTVQITPPPDLIVESVTARGEIWSGQEIEVLWSVANIGSGSTDVSGWIDRLYISADSTLDIGLDAYLGSSAYAGGLDTLETYSDSIFVVLPNGLDGVHYLLVESDADSQVYEHGQDDNNVGSVALTVSLTPPPDLQVTQLNVGSSVIAGEPVAVEWSVWNLGPGVTDPAVWYDAFYLSDDEHLDTGTDYALGGFLHSGALGPGNGYLEGGNLTVPVGFSGPHYLICRADSGDTVYEHTEEGNNTLAAAVDIQVPLLPDLQVIYLEVSQAEGNDLSVTWDVSNAGEKEVFEGKSFWMDGVYLSQDQVFDAATDLFIHDFAHSGALRVDSSYSRTAALEVPDSVSGLHYLFVVADHLERTDESSDLNNAGMIVADIDTIAVDLDLLDIQAPDSATSGQPISVTWQVQNAGLNDPEATTWHDAAYLSRDQILDHTDIVLGTRLHSGGLAPDGVYENVLASEAIPLGLSAPYYVFVRVDKNQSVYEMGEESNNIGYRAVPTIVTMPPPVDLVVSDVTLPSSGVSGDSILISWTVVNQSPNDFDGEWKDAVYVSRDTTWDLSDPRLGEISHSGEVSSRESYTVTLAVSAGDYFGLIESLLPGLVPGGYYAVVRTDIRNNIHETDDSNNAGASPDTIGVELVELALDVLRYEATAYNEQTYYIVNLPPDSDLRLTFDSVNPEDVLGVYVGYGEVPDRIHFDHTHQVSGHQEVLVPVPDESEVYLMVRGDFVEGEGDHSILAEAVPFGIDHLSLDRGGNDGFLTTTVFGAGFTESAVVSLQSESGSLDPVNSWVLDRTRIRAIFDLRGVTLGLRDVVVTRDGDIDSLSDGFTVEPGLGLENPVVSAVTGPDRVRRGRTATYTVSAKNISNIDAQVVTVALIGPNRDDLWMRPLGLTLFPDSLVEDPIYYEIGHMMTSETAKYSEVIVSGGLAPGETVHVPFLVNSGFSVSLGGMAYAASERDLREAFHLLQEIVRVQIVEDPDGLDDLPGLLAAAEDSASWVALCDSVLAPLGITGCYSNAGGPAVNMVADPLNETIFREYTEAQIWEMLFIMLDAAIETTDNADLAHWCAGFAGLSSSLHLLHGATVGVKIFKMIEYGMECIQDPECPQQWYNLAEGVNSILNAKYCIVDPETREVRWCQTGLLQFLLAVWFPTDPNEKVGPISENGDISISRDEPIPYTIYFENIPEATASAQRVEVVDTLAADVDLRTFRLGEIAFSDTVIAVPPSRSYIHTTHELPDGNLLEIDGGLNVLTREARWYFQTIDPETGEPPLDPFAGFLPPNDSTGVGEGHVAFSIKPLSDVEIGTEIRNRATIVFDVNDPIATDEVVNLIREDLPDLAPVAASVISQDGMFTEGEELVLDLTVVNSGEAVAPQFSIAVYDSAFLGSEVVDSILVEVGLEPGDSVTVSIPWVPHRVIGAHRLTAVADWSELVTEVNEFNNCRDLAPTVLPRTFTVALDEDISLIALPLEREDEFTARTLAQDVGANVMVRYDSSGHFHAFLPGVHQSDGFPIGGSEGYIAVIDVTDEVVFEGMTNVDSVSVAAGLNFLSQPLMPDSSVTARAFCENVGAGTIFRFNSSSRRFEEFNPSEHAGDGFEILGAHGYFVIAENDTTVFFSGTGWKDTEPPGLLMSSLPLALGDTIPSELAPVFAVGGGIFESTGSDSTQITQSYTAGIRNKRSGAWTDLKIDHAHSEFSGAFVDLYNTGIVGAGDLLQIVVTDSSGAQVGDTISHHVTIEEIEQRYAVFDAVIPAPAGIGPGGIPAKTRLYAASPNPFSSSTEIRFSLSKPGETNLKVFDVRGRLVKTLKNERMEPGKFVLTWRGSNDSGRQVAPGTYFYRLSAPGYECTKKMIRLE